MADPLDLHALANMPGFGTAQTALKKAGKWDEYAGQPLREYRVRVSYSINHTDTEIVTVKARCEGEANEKACDAVEDMHELDVDIDYVEIVEAAR